MKSMQ